MNPLKFTNFKSYIIRNQLTKGGNMKKIILLVILLIFVSWKIYGEEKRIFLPKLDNNIITVLSYFETPEEADNYLKTHTNVSDYFKAGYY
jgi:hypothetical protein